MSLTVTEIAPDCFRLSAYHDGAGIQFNSFLIRDDEPFLMHTGMNRQFEDTLAAVRTLIDPATLRWIGFSHFEPDECGALNPWLAVATHAQPVCSLVGARMLEDFAERPARAMRDDESLTIGHHSLRFLQTPYVPHAWDAGLFFDETTHTLMCSDLFFHPGNPVPLTEDDIVIPAKAALEASLATPAGSGMPYTPQTVPTLQHLAALEPQTLAVMHGSSFHGNGAKALDGLARVVTGALAPAQAHG